MVVVGHSGEREGGEGLFAVRDLPAKTVAAFYNGVRLAGCDLQGWEEEEEADCDYRIYVNMINLQEVQDDGSDVDVEERLDIPGQYRSVSQYCATLAHKCNHSFSPNCEFSQYLHPRYGLLPCILTTRPVRQGEELLTYYRYLLSDCPQWYSDLWDRS